MITNDVNQTIYECSELYEIRTLILIDKRTRLAVYGLIDHHYDTDKSVGGIKALFDETFDILRWQASPAIIINPLAIMNHIGLMKISVVTKHGDGNITIEDGERISVSDYMGLE